VRDRLIRSVIAIAVAIGFGALLLPLRTHVSATTIALLFVIPVVASVVLGGLFIGIIETFASAITLDYLFLQPYNTLSIATTQNWVALVVYVAVVLIVARVVTGLKQARLEADRGAQAMRRVFELSELLVQNRSVDDLLKTIVQAVQNVFTIPGVSLLVLENERLKVAASVGDALSAEELRQLDPHSGVPMSIRSSVGPTSGLRTVSLSASSRPVGILVFRDVPMSPTDQSILITFANDAALAIEQTQLREQAMRTHLLEEIDNLRQALMGAVSHDLRTPLATIKLASSTLANRSNVLSSDDALELFDLIDIEADRLTRLVTNLLDMTRIEAGVLVIRPSSVKILDLVNEAIAAMGAGVRQRHIVINVPVSTANAMIDHQLILQVLINLLDNANRHSPLNGVITVSASDTDGALIVSVADEGPGVAVEDRQAIFNRFAQFNTGGRAGLGLTIARTFVEAHGEKIWCDDALGEGARFSFSLPRADRVGISA
jgi:two-component system sensor histidine kinase KdpD